MKFEEIEPTQEFRGHENTARLMCDVAEDGVLRVTLFTDRFATKAGWDAATDKPPIFELVGQMMRKQPPSIDSIKSMSLHMAYEKAKQSGEIDFRLRRRDEYAVAKQRFPFGT